MATKQEKLQNAWHRYEGSQRHQPASARQAVEWAVAEGVLELPKIDPYDVLAGEMADALRAEIRTDDKGRRYRVNHAMRVTKGGVQYTFWGELGFAPHSHMEKAFAQRREQIVGDCVQLKTDVDVYNDMNSGEQTEIQLVLDFADDVVERQMLGQFRKRNSTAEEKVLAEAS
jgi:hypothetical protein